MKILDFTHCKTGTLVKRSKHYLKQHEWNRNLDKKQIGIITEKEFFNGENGIICFPVIHWEGEVTARLNHPANATPMREHTLPIVENEIK